MATYSASGIKVKKSETVEVELSENATYEVKSLDLSFIAGDNGKSVLYASGTVNIFDPDNQVSTVRKFELPSRNALIDLVGQNAAEELLRQHGQLVKNFII